MSEYFLPIMLGIVLRLIATNNVRMPNNRNDKNIYEGVTLTKTHYNKNLARITCADVN